MENKEIFCRGSEDFKKIAKQLFEKGIIIHLYDCYRDSDKCWSIYGRDLLWTSYDNKVKEGYLEVTPEEFLYNYDKTAINEKVVYCKGCPELLEVLKVLSTKGISIDQTIIDHCDNYYCSYGVGLHCSISGFHNESYYKARGRTEVTPLRFKELWLQSKGIIPRKCEYIGFKGGPEVDINLLPTKLNPRYFAGCDVNTIYYLDENCKLASMCLENPGARLIKILPWKEFLNKVSEYFGPIENLPERKESKPEKLYGFVGCGPDNLVLKGLFPAHINPKNCLGINTSRIYYMTKDGIIESCSILEAGAKSILVVSVTDFIKEVCTYWDLKLHLTPEQDKLFKSLVVEDTKKSDGYDIVETIPLVKLANTPSESILIKIPVKPKVKIVI